MFDLFTAVLRFSLVAVGGEYRYPDHAMLDLDLSLPHGNFKVLENRRYPQPRK